MRTMHFDYRMKLDFDTQVSNHRFTVRAFPPCDDMQQVIRLQYEIAPSCFLAESRDGFGNRIVYGYEEGPHSCFSIGVSGEVQTGLSGHLMAPEAWQLGMFRQPQGLTAAGEKLLAMAGRLPQSDDAQQYAWQIMDALHAEFSYRAGVTHAKTTAEQALQSGAGVCQDYAHIMLALLRLRRIACRYVVGLMAGEGQSHAWVDVYTGSGWLPLDPTNHRAVDDSYIRFSAGRDADDCAINFGRFSGFANQTSTISAVVRDMDS